MGLASVVLGGLLAWADFRWAGRYPEAARELAKRLEPARGRIYFVGHWGWQYYAEREGFQPWDARRRDVPDGAIMIVPVRVDRQGIFPPALQQLQLVENLPVPAHPLGLTTWNRQAGVRFYGGDYGEIPWGISSEPTERILIFRAGSD
jgi:hypothetical protein